MTYFIAALLILIGVASLGLYPPNRVAVPLLIAGVIVLVLRATSAIAADIPVPISRPLSMSKAEKHALRDLIAKGKMAQRPFERSLLSSAGKGRLE